MSDLSENHSREYIEQLGATAVRLGSCHSVLADVVVLAGEAPSLSDEQVRARLVRLADRAVRELSGDRR